MSASAVTHRRCRTIAYVASTSAYLAMFWRPMMRHMVDKGWRVVAVSPPDAFTSRVAEPGIEQLALPVSRQIGAFRSHLATWRGLYEFYRRERPLIVHHFTTNPVIYGSLAARRAGVPCIVNTLPGLGSLFTSRRWDAPLLRTWVRTAYRLSLAGENVRVVFQNPADRDLLVRQRVVRGERAVVIRGAGVDIERFVPVREPEGEAVILLCGRMLWSKGVGDLVSAARALRERGARFRVVLVGPAEPEHRDGVPVEQLERWSHDGIATWLGMRDDMPDIYAASHVVVLPTRYGEGIPGVLIEAAACGRPIVCYDVAGCREVVRNGRNGLLVPRGDLPALVAALGRLIENRALRETMGKHGREVAVAEFGSPAMIAGIAAVYAALGGERIESVAA